MAEGKLYAAFEKHVISLKDWEDNDFPQLHPKRTQQLQANSFCDHCGDHWNPGRSNQCVYHKDIFLLTMPSQHVGLLMGKGGMNLKKITKNSEVRSINVKDGRVEIKGLPAAVENAEKLIKRAVQKNMNLSPGKWRCCQQEAQVSGCQMRQMHNFHTIFQDNDLLMKTKDLSTNSCRVFALDCEMVVTSQGYELARITILDYTGTVCYDTFVLPPHPVSDYKTKFSGITASHLEGVTISLRDVQAELTKMISSKDILVGHGLFLDLHALHLVHYKVVDTSLVFPHRDGLPKKNSLRLLAKQFLGRTIQQECHDSKEDALACLDLMKGKVSC